VVRGGVRIKEGYEKREEEKENEETEEKRKVSYALCNNKSFQKLALMQWLKCKIRGGGTLHSGLGPRQWSCAFS